MDTQPSTDETAPRRRPLFLLGFLLFVLGPVIFFIQFKLGRLVTPWHVPILSTIGVLCMAVSVGQRRGIVRGVGFGAFVIVCVLEWLFVAHVIKTPVYAGPAEPGRKVPEFTATRADGRAFTHTDLEDGNHTVIVFFRGRW
jgi:hypothetical protein